MADDRLDVDLPEPADRDPVARALDATSHVEVVLAAWDTWDGDFVPFCEHVQLHLRIPLGRAAIRTILAAEGVRIPLRRQGRSKDADALRGQFRPENKAHVEGGFGLFFQEAPPLAVSSTEPASVAREIARLVLTTWGRTVNHRPRLDGRGTRVDLYRKAAPTPDEIAAARLALQERYRRQEEARKTAQARVDPVVRATLADAFARFAFVDPDGHLAAGIARYPVDAIVEGIAIFAARQRAGTLPEGVDARYLLGIVRHVTDENQLVLLTDELWRGRLAARDRIFVRLQGRRDTIEEDPPGTIEELLRRYVDLAVDASRRIDRFFWLSAVVDGVLETEPDDVERRSDLFRLVARRISATHRLARDERGLAIRFLAAKLAPLA